MGTPDIKWQDGSERLLHCKACRSTERMAHLVSVPHLEDKGSQVDYFRCPECRSLNPVAERQLRYTEPGSFSPESLGTRHYLHIGAGIDSMIRPLNKFGKMHGQMLDVGCGFGFTLDYWERAFSGSAVGLEASDYGALGRQILGVDIRSGYLDKDTALGGAKYDCVFSSEVIEHVDQPLEFLKAIRQATKSEGVAILTTPNADFILPTTPVGTLVAALSPGAHAVIFGADALRSNLLSSGFTCAEVTQDRERLMAYASLRMVDVLQRSEANQEQYISYLISRTVTATNPDLRLGLAYRALKELVAAGRFAEAEIHAHIYRKTTELEYAFDCFDLKALRAQGLFDCASLDHCGRLAPLSIACFTFYLAMLSAHHCGASFPFSTPNAFRLSAELCRHFTSISAPLSQEAASLAWVAEYECGLAYLVAGELHSALDVFDFILESSVSNELGLESPQEALLYRAAVQKATTLHRMDKNEQAMEVLQLASNNWEFAAPNGFREQAQVIFRMAHDRLNS